MIKLLIHGALGRMGRKVFEACALNDEIVPVCGVGRFEDFSNPNFPVYDSFEKVSVNADVIIDFSSATCLDEILKYSVSKKIPAVLCSTGYNEEDLKKINDASKQVAFFRSANMSLGINLLIDLIKKAGLTLNGYDVEIIEKHHNQKIDAPSGTALMLADAVKEVQPEKYYTYGRQGFVGKRNPDEIGIHAVRGGNIVGEHEVIFAGENEIITISHSASDRAVFANGALEAAKFLSAKKTGLFSMKDVIDAK